MRVCCLLRCCVRSNWKLIKKQKEESENEDFTKSEKLETYLMRQNILNKLFRRWTMEIWMAAVWHASCGVAAPFLHISYTNWIEIRWEYKKYVGMSYADRRRYTSHQRDEISTYAHATTAKMKTRMTTKWKNQEIKKTQKSKTISTNRTHITSQLKVELLLARAHSAIGIVCVSRINQSLKNERRSKWIWKKQHEIKRNEKKVCTACHQKL